jgi:hypothetical protein
MHVIYRKIWYKSQTSTSRHSAAAVDTVLLSAVNGACDVMGVNINSLLHGAVRDVLLFRDKSVKVIK